MIDSSNGGALFAHSTEEKSHSQTVKHIPSSRPDAANLKINCPNSFQAPVTLVGLLQMLSVFKAWGKNGASPKLEDQTFSTQRSVLFGVLLFSFVFETGCYYVAQIGLKHEIPLPPPLSVGLSGLC